MEKAYDEVFSIRVSAGSRTVFVDVKEMPDASHFLSLSELRKTETGSEERARIVVDAAYVRPLHIALGAAADYLDTGSRFTRDAVKRPAKKLSEVREQYPNAYTPWTPQADETLRSDFESGRTAQEIAHDMGRNKGSIKSRLTKLGLLAP